MLLEGRPLCVCIVAFLFSTAQSCGPIASRVLEEVEELPMPLRTFLPRWYKHSNGLNGGMGTMHQQTHSLEGIFYAQDEEDEAAERKYFPGMHAGIFVELGATDGELFSNTKFFEDHRGWRVSFGVKVDLPSLSGVVFV